jgi:hypothetical protein
MIGMRQGDELSPEMIERIAKEAAKIALQDFTEGNADAILKLVEERFYARVGKSGVEMVLKWVGMGIVALLMYLAGAGYLKPGG